LIPNNLWKPKKYKLRIEELEASLIEKEQNNNTTETQPTTQVVVETKPVEPVVVVEQPKPKPEIKLVPKPPPPKPTPVEETKPEPKPTPIEPKPVPKSISKATAKSFYVSAPLNEKKDDPPTPISTPPLEKKEETHTPPLAQKKNSISYGSIPLNRGEEQPKPIESNDWYYNTSRENAENILKSCKQANVFLVRPSSVPGKYTISRYQPFAQKEVMVHLLVNSKPWQIENAEGDRAVYSSLDELLSKTPVLETFKSAGLIYGHPNGI